MKKIVLLLFVILFLGGLLRLYDLCKRGYAPFPPITSQEVIVPDAYFLFHQFPADDVHSFWTPEQSTITLAREAAWKYMALNYHLDSTPTSWVSLLQNDLRRTNIQYVGIVSNGHRVLIISFFPSDEKEWNTRYIHRNSVNSVRSQLFWRISYDVERGKIVN